ncbi:HrpE/YscL family type III secretion apparatus protein [Pandoraea sputorum]|uniref:HrpE/YscL family type III secretion apparatus protein n=1 Tax=Pandoraea sputorum TaxID=93222 RepID=UPI002AF6A551|nr:HrpE/YscL family type III secretion apparatus protein [Pandoraea sputorum]
MDTPDVASPSDATFCVTPDGVRMTGATRVLRASELNLLTHAKDLVGRARDIAENTIAWGDHGYRKAFAAGYEAGMKQAAEQALRESLEMTELRMAELRATEQHVCELVLEVISRVLCEMDDYERIERIVRQGLRQLEASHGTVRVIVATELASRLSAKIPQWRAIWPRLEFQLEADAGLGKMQCRIETANGSVVGDLENVLEVLRTMRTDMPSACHPETDTPASPDSGNGGTDV